MATRYIEVTPTAPPNRTNARAAGVRVDSSDSYKLKYNANGTEKQVVDDSDVEVASVDGVTLEYSGGAVQVKDDGIDENKIVSTALDTDYLDGGSGDPLTLSAAAQAAIDLVAAIPTADQNDSETIWNDNGVLKVSSAP